jgi:GNAT superfamily N-acetyltransferase
MTYREATIEDIPQIQIVRNSVHENMLSNPALVTDSDCADYLTRRGRGWVCVDNETLIGFAICDLQNNNVWALFLLPAYEQQGIGIRLHDIMLAWYYTQTDKSIWLSTAPGTRAEGFYRAAGWEETGIYGKGEIKFEMTFPAWRKKMASKQSP